MSKFIVSEIDKSSTPASKGLFMFKSDRGPSNTSRFSSVKEIGICRSDLDSIEEQDAGIICYIGEKEDAVRAKKSLDSIISNMSKAKQELLRPRVVFYIIPKINGKQIKEGLLNKINNPFDEPPDVWTPSTGLNKGRIEALGNNVLGGF